MNTLTATPPAGRHRRNRAEPGPDPLYGTIAIVPARDEETGVLTALESLAGQSSPPDLIVVVVNNSSDRTEEYARAFAARTGVPATVVLNLPTNPHKKAGALNHGLAWISAQSGRRLADTARHVIVMDADTGLHPEFLARATRVMAAHPALGGVSASCLGRTGLWSTVWQRYLTGMQVIEYGRYSASRFRRNVHTMSGAGSFYRTEALQSLLDWRGEVFWEDHANLVEDYETTLALKESGWGVTSNQLCIAYTDLMPSLRDLLAQRERWVRGTVDVLRGRGVTRHTWQSIAAILLGVVGIAYTALWLTLSATAAGRHGWQVDPRYLWLAGFWSVYQAVSVRHLGWKAMAVEAAVLPELLFNMARNYWLVSSIVKSFAAKSAAWK